MIDVFILFIFAPFAEGNLNVSSGTAAVFPGYALRLLRRSRRYALINFGLVGPGQAGLVRRWRRVAGSPTKG
jgi:hypothetical protein